MLSPKKTKERLRQDICGRNLRHPIGENVKNAKPLQDKKFFLDLKNHITSSKLEANLKALGASIELFIAADVNFVVSDRDTQGPPSSGTASPSPSIYTPSPSPSPFLPSPSCLVGDTSAGVTRPPRSRAEAMLERVRIQTQQHHVVTHDPLDDARRWGIPIVTLDKVLKWVSKQLKTVESVDCLSRIGFAQNKITLLQGPYIKFENINRRCRPNFKELSSWPSLNLDSSSGCPFVTPENGGDDGGTNRRRKRQNSENPISKKIPSLSKNLNKEPGLKSPAATTRPNDTPTTTKQPPGPGRSESERLLYSMILLSVLDAANITLSKSSAADWLKGKNPLKEAYCLIERTSACELHVAALLGRMTRKARTRSTACATSTQQTAPGVVAPLLHPSGPGFCEACQVSYSDHQKHLASDQHQRFANEDNNYRGLDALISRGEGFGRLLQCLNGSASPITPTGGDFMTKSGEPTPPHSPISSSVNGHSTRAQNKEVLNGVKLSHGYGTRYALSPRRRTPTTQTHHLRSRGQIHLPPSLIGTTAEDDPPARRSSDEQKSIRRRSTIDEDSSDKRVRSDTCVPLTMVCQKQLSESNELTTPITNHPPKKRRSQLAVLSDEAESFMFGEPVKRVEDDEFEKKDLNQHEDKVYPPSSHLDESSMDSCSLASSDTTPMRRKRRTHAEKFIEDNREYYKFEVTGSRLRYHGTSLPQVRDDSPTKERNHHSNETEEYKMSNLKFQGNDKKMNIDSLSYSFENVPQGLTWFQTYLRQDLFEERHYYDSNYRPAFLLPYEVIALRQQGTNGSSLLTTSQSPIFRKRRRKGAIAERKSRKSPRCHASTLAILGGLSRRGRRSNNNTSLSDITEESPSKDASPIKTETTSTLIPSTPISTAPVHDIDNFSDNLEEIVKHLKLEKVEESDIPLQTKLGGLGLDLLSILETYQDSQSLEFSQFSDFNSRLPISDTVSECTDSTEQSQTIPTRPRRRKKRKNMTGWPAAQKLKAARKRLLARRLQQHNKLTSKRNPSTEDDSSNPILTETEGETLTEDEGLAKTPVTFPAERIGNNRRLRSASGPSLYSSTPNISPAVSIDTPLKRGRKKKPKQESPKLIRRGPWRNVSRR